MRTYLCKLCSIFLLTGPGLLLFEQLISTLKLTGTYLNKADLVSTLSRSGCSA